MRDWCGSHRLENQRIIENFVAEAGTNPGSGRMVRLSLLELIHPIPIFGRLLARA